MLDVNRSAGVAPEVNLRNTLNIGDKACKQKDSPLLLNPGQIKQGYQLPTERSHILQQILIKST